MLNNIMNLKRLINEKDINKFYLLLFMMVIAALFETIGIGLIVPIVGIITNPSIIESNFYLNKIFYTLNFSSTNKFVIFGIFALLVVYIFKNAYLFLFNFVQYKVILSQQLKLSKRLFTEYLKKPYVFHLEQNSSTLLRNINEEIPKVFQGIVLSYFQIITEVLVIILILGLLLFSSPLATMSATLILLTSLYFFVKYFKGKITSLGKEQQQISGNILKWINQGLGASKEIKVAGNEDYFVNSYSRMLAIKISNSRYIKLLEILPRLFIEILLVSIVLCTLLITVFQGSDTSKLMTTMALFAMAAFRLMPSINKIVGLITTIRYSQPALKVIYEDLFVNSNLEKEKLTLHQNQHLNNIYPSFFKEEIKLNNVSFRYPDKSDFSINNVSLTIKKGESVAIIGESGSGKTTLMDIILGLYSPQQGEILIDNKQLEVVRNNWIKVIGYIPQNIFLTDNTIRNNIAFGVEENEINEEIVWDTLEKAQLKSFVENLPDKLNTVVGERGVKLSGGQRQRLGIARALYNNPEIIFMDEGTSALDNETEKEVMKAIDCLKGEKTLIIIAHRLSTIENCDISYKLDKGKIVSENKKYA
ncbi:ABC transporter ATP-binding protein [Bacillus sp. RO2]|uniref:ABC transporter ATP-binding protein n=1 Tax=Bacillus sp. RO2 TaxID=2723913 RepID=UPI0032175257